MAGRLECLECVADKHSLSVNEVSETPKDVQAESWTRASSVGFTYLRKP